MTVTTCISCGGLGFLDVGDPENGVTRTCPECEGQGTIRNVDAMIEAEIERDVDEHTERKREAANG